jgi:hypothetical protein
MQSEALEKRKFAVWNDAECFQNGRAKLRPQALGRVTLRCRPQALGRVTLRCRPQALAPCEGLADLIEERREAGGGI